MPSPLARWGRDVFFRGRSSLMRIAVFVVYECGKIHASISKSGSWRDSIFSYDSKRT
jgi:hypothetical protein